MVSGQIVKLEEGEHYGERVSGAEPLVRGLEGGASLPEVEDRFVSGHSS